MLLVDCSSCRTPLEPPPGARSFRCSVCSAITHVSGHLFAFPRDDDTHGRDRPALPRYQHQQRAPPPPPAHGRKRAVIIGVSYRNTRRELKGCVNDARCMKYLLVNRFGFPEASIIVLTEEETDPLKIPTKQNIRMAMHWLVQGCQPGDSLVFHYSGHGSQQRNYNGDEVDGYDETLLPVDYKMQGVIVDDEINATIVRPLPRGAKLHAIIDACHSGTVLDLPFLCRMNRDGQYAWEDHRPRSGAWKGTSGGEAIAFSGCDDDQRSTDTTVLSRTASTGAMTFCFIQAIEQGNGATYGSILNSMRSTIRNISKTTSGRPITTLLSMLLPGGILGASRQEPQLTSCECFDVYEKPFSL